ncbi:MAG: histidine--tRNA ligase [Candidatus Lokiarchaeota archaeon]|nr:histidine--tRNA ligase [Candidatus Lokiarchaeota archaeon]
MVNLRILKGTQDKPVDESIIQSKLLSIIRDTYERYGFNPLETPILEFTDILSSKYAGGAEILKEIYTLKDNGDRNLALRYDLTVPLCRYIGMVGTRSLKLPFKRYEIGKVFRDGPVKVGRYREFIQCDVDVIDSKDLLHDAEICAIICEVLDNLGKDFYIEINNRKLLVGIIEDAGIDNEDLQSKIILSIDKLKKIGEEGVKNELIEKGIGPSTYDPIFENIGVKKDTNQDLLDYYEKNLKNPTAQEGISELRKILDYLEAMAIHKEIRFRPELARGLEIYTGTIFEAFFKDAEITSSVAAGGRYDKIIGKFLGKNKVVPAVGATIGIDVILADIYNNLDQYSEIFKAKTCVQVLIIPIKIDVKKVIPVAAELRNNGINCEVFIKKKKAVSKGLSLADSEKIPISIIIGPTEIENDKYSVKNMITGKQISTSLGNLSENILKILNYN